MSIQGHLNKIRNAIKGSEVRESIARGIETAYDDASEYGNANMEVKIARGTHPNLRSRLEEVDNKQQQTTAEMAQKANYSEVRKKHVPIGLNDFDGEALGVIQDGTGGTPINVESIPRNGSVSKEKTTFFGVTSRNKFDKKKAQKNKGLGLDGNLYEWSNFFVSDLIPTKSGDTWRATNNLQAYVIYNTDGEKQSAEIEYDQNSFTVETDGFIRVSAWHTTFDHFMITNESLPSEYEEYSYVITRDNIEPIRDNSLGLEKLSFAKTISRNLFDKSRAVVGALDSAGVLHEHTTAYRTTHYISVHENDKITFGGYRVEGYSFTNRDGNVIEANDGELFSELTTPSGASLLRVSFWSDVIDTFMVVIGEPVETYEPYKFGIPSEYLEITDSRQSKYQIEENIYGVYKRTDDSYLNSWSLDSGDVYGVFNQIVSDFPEWAKRVIYGKSADGRDLYKYSFKPPLTMNNRTEQPLPLFVVTNTHSFEKPALAGTTQFFKDLAYNWASNDELRVIRWNVHFEVIPVVNPYGADNRSRPNPNGVDINRNFTSGWSNEGANGEFGSDYYSGTEPMSEPETQMLDKLMREYSHADYAIDVHNYTSLEQSDPSSVLWTGSNDEVTRKRLLGYTSQTASIAQAKYIHGNVAGYDNLALGLVENISPYGGATVWQWESYGNNTTLLELVSDFGTNAEDVQTFSVEAIGNLILNGLRNFI